MDWKTKRPDHIEDVLIRLRSGHWFGWSDTKNRVYENLIIRDPEAQSPENKAYHGIWSTEKPTQEFLESELQRMQGEFDAQDYARDRQSEYPPIQDQLDYIYHNSITKWKSDMIKPVKDAHPKP